MEAGFNFGLIENYLAMGYRERDSPGDAWKEFFGRAKDVDLGISESIIADLLDYCFVGSTQKYLQVDL